ncbi:HD domain-containing protein [Natronococcus occultus]|uniref:5'-deoxynucleotidase n=1 Tax=Natronococcus occultus SP4 TaxID=694430 RepID=L0JVY8_9EURY|nr:HD domain-containing protein [Natronococcus occultus]AGB36465.1 putative HD superfamily hydrolase [Natronococcus occultus SP4]
MDDADRDGTAGVPNGTEAVLRSLALKDERRTGWQLRGVEDPESVAAHSWGVALLCLCYAPAAGIDPDRALRMAVVHDLAEAEIGDVPTRADSTAETVDPETKERRERTAIAALLEPFGDELRTLWERYERREDDVARFVKDMDLVDMCLQAVRYERERRYDPTDDPDDAFREYDHLDEFFATAEPRIRTDVGRVLFEDARRRYETARDTRASDGN